MSIGTVVRNSAWIGVAQILNFAFPLLTLPVAARAFGPGTYGLIASLTAIMSYAGLVVTFGFHLTGPRLVARTPDDPEALSEAFSTVYLGQILFAGVAVLVGSAALLAFGGAPGRTPLGSVLLLAVVASALTPMWVFVGLQSVGELVPWQLVLRAAAAIVIVASVRREADALLYVSVNTASTVAVCAAALIRLRRRGIVVRRVALGRVLESIKGAGRLFLSSAAISLYTTSNLVVVGLVLGPVAAGYFALADRVRAAVISLFDPVSQALYPYLCSTAASASRDQNKRVFFRGLVVLSVLAAAALFFASPLIASVLGGERFAHSVPLLQVLSLTPVLICLSNILGIQTMLPDDMERELSWIVTGAGLIGIPLLVAMTVAFGQVGAAWSYVIVETGVTLAMAIVVRRRHALLSLFFRPAGERAAESIKAVDGIKESTCTIG